MIARLRNHYATDDGNVDFKFLKTILHSKLGKQIEGIGFTGSKAIKGYDFGLMSSVPVEAKLEEFSSALF